VFTNLTNCVVANNVIVGRGNGYGTINVTQGSGTINGTDTYFSTIAAPSPYSDVDNFIVIEGDATLYKITTVNSTTQVVVTPTVARTTASGLRYQIASTGDLMGVAGAQYATFSANIASYGHDNGLSFGESTTRGTQYCTITGNLANYNAAAGLVISGTFQHNVITGNSLTNNGNGVTQTSPAGLRSGIVLEPTTSLRSISGNSFTGNKLADTRGGSATQTYGIAFNPYGISGGDAVITANGFAENLIEGNTTGAMNKTSIGPFAVAPRNALIKLEPVAFADLGTPENGTIANCFNCTITNPCASGGPGAIAKRLNGVWVCN
jgi:parallel beta-helix repeat protein